MVNKKAWVRIIESFVAVLLIVGVLLFVIESDYIREEDISSDIYDIEINILREIQIDNSLRSNVIDAGNPPLEWYDNQFPNSIKTKINSRIPSYLNCTAKICEIDDECKIISVYGNVYVQSAMFGSDSDTYSPRQLKLSCWDKLG